MAGSGDGERAGPADRVVVGGQLRHRLGVFPVVLNGGLRKSGNWAAGPVGGGEKLRLEAMAEAEDRAGNGHAGANSKRRALCIEDGRAAELL